MIGVAVGPGIADADHVAIGHFDKARTLDMQKERIDRIVYPQQHLGATVELRRDATQPVGLFDSAHIVGRAGTGTLQIEVEPEGKFPWLDNMVDGTPVRIRNEWGTESTNNRFIVSVPGATLTGETPGDQNGFGTREFAFTAASRRYDGTDADETEVVITYINSSTQA